MKICCYTIALNEAHEVADWLAATKDADHRVVLDTGSTDGTDDLLQAAGVSVFHGVYRPWRFDDPFNAALALIPSDIDMCFRLDMDERPRAGWRHAIEAAFDDDVTMLRYPYHWSAQSAFYGDRIHKRHGYRWRGVTHEGLVWRGGTPEFVKFVDAIVVDHFQKPKQRPNDLLLLKEAVDEFPTDARLCLYYARELVFHRDKRAIKEILRFQSFSVAATDLSYSWRLLAQADPVNAAIHLNRAASVENNASVELALALHWYEREWALCYQHMIACIDMITDIGHWTDDLRLRTSYPHDIASIAAWNIGDREAARRHVLEAFRHDPNERITNNVIMMHDENLVFRLNT